MKRTPLARTSAPLTRRTPLSRGKGPQTRDGEPLRGTAGRRAPISPASRAQRAKVRAEGRCRRCGAPDSVTALHPAHIIDRSLGGCDDPLCVIPVCPACHRAYDDGRADFLPVLTYAEQGHAAAHVGLIAALRRIVNDREPIL